MRFSEDREFVLAGDIGGTKTNMALFHMVNDRPIASVVETYASRDEPGFEKIVQDFLGKHGVFVSSACFGVAGPVIDGRCRATNLPWVISEKKITKSVGFEYVKVVNDLEAMAYGIPLLKGSDIFPLNTQKIKKKKNFGLIAPGTGLGMVLSIWNNGRYLAVSSEGGHSDFVPANREEFMLSQYIKRRYGHASMERIISGPGIENIYMWLRDSGRYKEPRWLLKHMNQMDPSRVITQAAMKNKTPICVKTLNIFISALGAAAGNLALTGLTLGGIYLGGGIPHKILPWLKSGLFMDSFVAKGRFKNMLKGIAVRVLLNEKTPLQGAASIAFDSIKRF